MMVLTEKGYPSADAYEKELLSLLETVRYQAKQDTTLQIAERMLDYGVDVQLTAAVTGLTRDEILSGKRGKIPLQVKVK